MKDVWWLHLGTFDFLRKWGYPVLFEGERKVDLPLNLTVGSMDIFLLGSHQLHLESHRKFKGPRG